MAFCPQLKGRHLVKGFNEHEPVSVHGKFQDRESRAEIIVVKGPR